MALWRTKGFEGTTVTDICKAAGVSKALFYVYFSRKEDVLHEAELFAMRDAHVAAQSIAAGSYDLADVVTTVLEPLVDRMRRFPAELIFEAVIESYRLERQALAEGSGEPELTMLFLTPFEQARRDGKLPSGVDPAWAARIAQTLVSDGIRRWAASGFADKSVVTNLGGEVAKVLNGLGRRPKAAE
jgi:AcrR family transcriptional regulator